MILTKQHRALVLVSLMIVVPLMNFVAFRSKMMSLINYTPSSQSSLSNVQNSKPFQSFYVEQPQPDNHHQLDDQQHQQQHQRQPEQLTWSGYNLRPEHRRILPLTELTQSNNSNNNNHTSCPPGQVYVADTVLDPVLAFAIDDDDVNDNSGGRRRRQIPRIIHVTARQRCMAPEFAQVLDAWRFPNHSLFLHDDASMERLLHRHWAEFPALNALLRCFHYGGAMKADVWRLLVMWEYGGIYTDIDNVPVKFNGTTLQPSDQGFFQIEQLGTPSQWFFAIAPRHPLMYHCMQILLANIVTKMQDTGKPTIVKTTGPWAIMEGFKRFAKRATNRVTEAGVYTNPTTGHSVKLVGTATNQDEWVKRCVWNNTQKAEIMQRSNMTHITKFGLKANNVSCVDYMYQLDHQWSMDKESSLNHELPVYW